MASLPSSWFGPRPSPKRRGDTPVACLRARWRQECRHSVFGCFALIVFALPLDRARAADDDNATTLFGSSKRAAGALIGILYDFKQTQKRQPVPMERRLFESQVVQFIESDWDEGVLNNYYRVPRALYATELQINTIDADTAPRSFGVEKTVEPRTWLVHYKGQVAAPEDGTYRFLGEADDFVAVAINGKTVLVQSTAGTNLKVKWFPREKTELRAERGGQLTAGDWIEAKAGKPMDIDIVTGESPGGQFRCLLHIEKKGGPTTGTAPPFQLATSKEGAVGAQAWKGVQ